MPKRVFKAKLTFIVLWWGEAHSYYQDVNDRCVSFGRTAILIDTKYVFCSQFSAKQIQKFSYFSTVATILCV